MWDEIFKISCAEFVEMSTQEMLKVKGIGKKNISKILALQEWVKREPNIKHRVQLSNSKTVYKYFKYLYMGEMREVAYLVSLNSKNIPIDIYKLSIGSIDTAKISLQALFKKALSVSACKLFLLHNHPSGNPTPSKDDVEFTKKVSKACDLFNIELLDHIIFGNEGYISLREAGLYV